ncbi:MAG: MEDS domain-containing protein [Acidobacteriales bacterium]|nr:MEDS domain-containing protein [Terriglobales bacterium]
MELVRQSKVHPAGAHIAYLYYEDEERRQVSGDFIRGGLTGDELVVYLPDVVDQELNGALEELGVFSVDDVHSHKLLTLSATATFCPQDSLIPDVAIAQLRGFYERAHSDGFTGARVIGQETWALRGIPGSEHLVDLEFRVNNLIATNPMTILCQYDMRRFDGATGFAVLGAHPLLLMRGRVVPNPYLNAPLDRPLRRRA